MTPPRRPYWRRLAGSARRAARRLAPRTRPAVLMYHRVAAESFDPWGLAVEPGRFAAQMEWIAGHRTVLPLGELARLHGERRLPPDALALTFDDGYACSMDVAAPVLDRLGLAATIFLPVALIERQEEFWWDELERLVLSSSADSLTLDGESVALGRPDRSDRSWPPGNPPRTPRQQAFHRLWSLLRERTPEGVDQGLSQLRAQSDGAPPTRGSHRPMTPAQARASPFPTIEFGSHGLSHPFLPALSDSEQRRELGDSRPRCEALTGRLPAALAYPYGAHDRSSRELAREAGYAVACTTEHAFVKTGSDPLRMPRLHVGNWDLPQFRHMLGGAL